VYSDLQRFGNCTLWYILLGNNMKRVGMSLHNVDTYIVFVYSCYSLVKSVRNKFWTIVEIFIAYNCFYNFNGTYYISFTYIWFHFCVWFSINNCTFVQDDILYYSLPMTQTPALHCTVYKSPDYTASGYWFYKMWKLFSFSLPNSVNKSIVFFFSHFKQTFFSFCKGMNLKQACFWFLRVRRAIVRQMFAMSLGQCVDNLIDNGSNEDPCDNLMFGEYFPLVWRTVLPWTSQSTVGQSCTAARPWRRRRYDPWKCR
jgi:hypothetical protein